MSLGARLRRLEGQVEWLQDAGMLRKCELQLKAFDIQNRIIREDPEFAAEMGWFPQPESPPPPFADDS